jgi:type I restriction enzyme S subunit
MAREWQRYKIGDLFDLVPGFAFRSDDFMESGVPVIKIKNVKANAIVLNDLSYVDSRFLERRKDNIIKLGDILITMSGNRFGSSKDTWVGKVAQFRNSGLFLLNQRVGILRPKRKVEVDRRCCAYFLGSDDYQNLFISIATSSGGQANLSPNQILGADILLPPIDEQRAIAHILGTLDDKIELNRRMNETLEAMARAIFKSWFVDFDPVIDNALRAGNPIPSVLAEKAARRRELLSRANAEGRDSCFPKHIADLFPDRFVDSELGPIPAGWEVGTLV